MHSVIQTKKKVILISELGENTKYFPSLDTIYFLSLDTAYFKVSICFVAFSPSLFHFILNH